MKHTTWFANKKRIFILFSAAAVLAFAALIVNAFLRFEGLDKPLAITQKYVELYNIDIDDVNERVVGRMVIEKSLEKNEKLFPNADNEFHKKYTRLLAQNKKEYMLTDLEIAELVLSAGTYEKINEAWENVSKSKRVQIEGTGDNISFIVDY